MLARLPLLGLAATPSAQCITTQGRTVCGYDCRSSPSDAACATTPYGVCQVLAGRVHCWDPPLVVIQHPPSRPVSPECKESRGHMACGYNCQISEGEVDCTRTPYGVCTVSYGRLFCWDPPDSAIHEYGAQLPAPRCATANTSVACGYDCKSTRGEVQCAKTPKGLCRVDDSRFTCFDPPSLLHCDHSAPPPPSN
jgi:hypothetical protein